MGVNPGNRLGSTNLDRQPAGVRFDSAPPNQNTRPDSRYENRGGSSAERSSTAVNTATSNVFQRTPVSQTTPNRNNIFTRTPAQSTASVYTGHSPAFTGRNHVPDSWSHTPSTPYREQAGSRDRSFFLFRRDFYSHPGTISSLIVTTVLVITAIVLAIILLPIGL